MTTATLTSPTLTTDTHGVFAHLADDRRVRLTDPASWDTAQAEWTKLDDARRAGRYPHVRHFEVRSMADPGYKDSPVMLALAPVLAGQRGTTDLRAARRAWRLRQGDVTPNGASQGTGGVVLLLERSDGHSGRRRPRREVQADGLRRPGPVWQVVRDAAGRAHGRRGLELLSHRRRGARRAAV